jgi:hypothetical protein
MTWHNRFTFLLLVRFLCILGFSFTIAFVDDFFFALQHGVYTRRDGLNENHMMHIQSALLFDLFGREAHIRMLWGFLLFYSFSSCFMTLCRQGKKDFHGWGHGRVSGAVFVCFLVFFRVFMVWQQSSSEREESLSVIPTRVLWE